MKSEKESIEKILKMIKDGSISSEEGVKILKQLKQASSNKQVHYFNRSWVKKNIEQDTKINGYILIFDYNSRLYNDLNYNSQNIILVKKGEQYNKISDKEYSVNPEDIRSLSKLFASIVQSKLNISNIIYNWANALDDLEEDNEIIKQTPEFIFSILKIIVEENIESIGKFLVVLNSKLDNLKAFVTSTSILGKSINVMLPNMHLSTIDIGNSKKFNYENLIYELNNKDEFDVIKYDGERYVKVCEEIKLIDNKKHILSTNGVYIVTGGKGKVGQIVSKYLASKYKANIIITGRAIENNDVKELLDEIENLGGKGFYYSADSGNIIEMKNVIEDVLNNFGIINGIFHVAGLSSDKNILVKNKKEFKNVLYPKINGITVLDEATKNVNLDFFVTFSSTAAILGDLGLCDYSLANKFMDDFCEYRNELFKKGERNGVSITINWPLWKNGGMHLDPESEKLYLKSSNLEYLNDHDGITSLEKIINNSYKQVIVMSGDKNSIYKSLLISKNNSKAEKVNIKEINVEHHLINDLKKLASKILKLEIDEIDINENFAEYGFDSLSLKEFSTKTSGQFGIRILPTTYFSYSNINSLAKYIIEEFKTSITEYYISSEEEAKEEIKENIVTENHNDIEVKNDDAYLESKKSSHMEENKDVIDINDIAIIGINGVFPKSKDLDEFWDNLINKKDLISEIPEDRWDFKKYYSKDNKEINKINSKWGGFIYDVDKFDGEFFNISPREAELIDPQQRIFLEVAWKAIEDSGYKVSELSKRNVGVFSGVEFADYQQLIFSNVSEAKAHIGTGNANTMIPNRVSYYMNLSGPSESIDTACSSSLVAINRAVKSIITKECDMAIAGGVSLTLSPRTFLGAGKLGVLAPDGRCKTFSKDANGYVKGEGVGAIVLKPLKKAIEDGDNIYAVIKSIKENHGGHANSITAPNSEAQANLLVSAYEECGIDPENISYIETHGTGTELGDPIEVEGILKAFKTMAKNKGKEISKENYCGIGSVKTNVGHLEPAAGIVSIIKVILSMKNKMLPGIMNFTELNPYIKLDKEPLYIVKNNKKWNRLKDENGNEIPRIAGISCFGFGGTNTHAVLEEYIDNRTEKTESRNNKVIVISAKDTLQLEKYVEEYIKFIGKLLNNSSAEKIKDEVIELIAGEVNLNKCEIDRIDYLDELVTDKFEYRMISKKLSSKYSVDISPEIISQLNNIGAIIDEITKQVGNSISDSVSSNITLADVAYTLQVGREEMNCRLAIVASDFANLKDKLISFLNGEQNLESFYCSDKNGSNKDEINNILSGQDKKRYITECAQSNNMNDIARLWTLGCNIDWKLLNLNGKRVSIPTYPFKKVSHWIGSGDNIKLNEESSEDKNKKEYIHPFIHENTSNIKGLKYTSYIEKFNKDYDVFRMDKKLILPTSILSEIAFTCYRENLGNKECYIKNLVWQKPVLIDELKKYDIVLNQIENGLVCDFVDNSSDSIFARVQLVEGKKESTTRFNVSEIRERCINKIDSETFYDKLKDISIEYYKKYKVINELYESNSEVLVAINEYERETLWNTDFIMVEAAVQISLFIWKSKNKEAKGLLKEISHIEVDRLLPSAKYIYANKSKNDYYVLNSDGDVLGTIKNCRIVKCKNNEENDNEYMEAFFRKRWKENPISISSKDKQNIMILSPKNQLDKWVRLVEKDSNKLFNYHIASTGDYKKVLNKYEIDTILDLYDLENEYDETYERIEVLQEVVKNNKKEKLFLFHFTLGLNSFKSQNTSLKGAKIALIYKMLGAEYKAIKSRTIDLDFSLQELDELTRIVSSELSTIDGASEICYREGKRYCPSLEKINVDSKNTINISSKKTIIISGGTGGIGSEILKRLVSLGLRKFILIERRSIPRKEQWNQFLNDSNTSKSIVRKINLLKFLEDKVCDVKVYANGFEDENDLKKFIFNDEYIEIGGVIHCAGISNETNPAFIKKSKKIIKETLAPKIIGTNTLFNIVKDKKPDFFILFSSVSALVPKLSVGASVYALANSYLDYFAEYQNSIGNSWVKSIAWPRWNSVGMQGIESKSYLELGFKSIDYKQGIDNLVSIINEKNGGSIIPLVFDKEKLDYEEVFNPRVNTNHKIINSSQFKETSHNDSINADSNLINKIKGIFANELGLDTEKVDINTQFEAFGVDSIMIAELVVKLEEGLKTSVEPSTLIEYPTILELASYIESKDPKPLNIIKVHNDKNIINTIDFYENSEEIKSIKSYSINKITSKNDNKIAVIGVSCNFPKAKNKEEYWSNLSNKVNCVTEVPKNRWDINKYYSSVYEEGKSISKWGAFIDDYRYFDAKYFNINENDAIQYDPLIRLFLEESTQTFRDAGYEKAEISGKNVGVFVGARTGGFTSKLTGLSKNSVTGIGQNFIAAHVSHFFNLKGPNMVLDSACSSSLVSIHLACQSLNTNECELALAGGVDVVYDEKTYILMSEAKALSPDGKCHTFDKKANGFVQGEGCGAVLLKKLDKAIEDGDHIYAVIDATTVNNDGHTMGITTPNPEEQFNVINNAICKANINPETIGYIEAHGTGTMIGDPIELKALTKVFSKYTNKKQFCGVGSVKSNMGHLMSAAGIASFIKVVLGLENKMIPPTINCEEPNERFEFNNSPFYIVNDLMKWEKRNEIRRAGISAFGFGGTNAHIIVSEYNEEPIYKCTRKALSPVVFNKKYLWNEPLEDNDKSKNDEGILTINIDIGKNSNPFLIR